MYLYPRSSFTLVSPIGEASEGAHVEQPYDCLLPRDSKQMFLEGQLQTRKWEDKDGIEKYTTEVVLQNFNGNLTMLGGRNDNSSSDFGSDSIPSESTSLSTDVDDDIPF